MRPIHGAFAISAWLAFAGCGSSSPSSPSSAPPGTPIPSGGLTFKAYGTITEVPPGFNSISGARVEIIAGSGTGASAMTDGSGDYSLGAIPTGAFTLQVTRDGYQPLSKSVTLNRDLRTDFLLYPVPPTGATARCKDKSWSYAADRASACNPRGGGVSYWVCPGPLCQG